MAKHPAAFINALAEAGTKEDAIRYLQAAWDDYVDLRKAIAWIDHHEPELVAAAETKFGLKK